MSPRAHVKWAWLAQVVVVAMVAAACSSGGGGGGGEDADASGSWTVLVYLSADNDLEPDLMTNLEQMASVGSNENLNLVVLADRTPNYSAEPVLNIDNWVTTKTFEVGQDELVEIDDAGELDVADPATLADFVARGFEDHPADHYAVVISDHGGGWTGAGVDETTEPTPEEAALGATPLLTLPDIQQGLTEGLRRSGVDRLDLVGFDACLMATYEVAQAMAPLADYLLASEELEPGHGWDWGALDVLSDGDADAAALGDALLRGFQSESEAEGTVAEVTLSLVDLARMEAVAVAIQGLTDALAGDMDQLAPTLGQVRAQTLEFGKNDDGTNDTGLTDLGQLIERLSRADASIAAIAGEARSAIDAAVVGEITGATTSTATGLSAYFPPTGEQFAEQSETGADYTAVQDDAWAGLLDAYYRAGADIPPDQQVTFEPSGGGAADHSFDEEGITVTGTFSDGDVENLSEAILYYGRPRANGSTVFVGEQPGAINDDGTASATFDLRTLTISDGTDVLDAYLGRTGDLDAETFDVDIPLLYQAEAEGGPDDGAELTLSIVVDPDGNVTSAVYYIDHDGTLGQFTPDPDGQIIPLLQVQRPGSDQAEFAPVGDRGLRADPDGLTFEFEPLASGSPLAADLTAIDYGGNASAVSVTTSVP